MAGEATAAQPVDILAELARLGETRTWEPGATVVAEGDVADCLYIVHAGELRATVLGEGGRTVELNTLGVGEVFGELMLSGELRAATVQVTVRARLTRVTRAEVERALAERPELALQLIQRLVQRVRTLRRPSAAWRRWMSTGGWSACSTRWPCTTAAGTGSLAR